MYADEYGTDWQAPEFDRVLERAYALGVSESLGEVHEGELERLVGEADSAHDRSLVRLAYDKGRSRGLEASPEDRDDRSTWESLVNEEERERVAIDDRRELPPSLRSLPLLEPPGDGLDRVRLPRFLLRR